MTLTHISIEGIVNLLRAATVQLRDVEKATTAEWRHDALGSATEFANALRGAEEFLEAWAELDEEIPT